jgi:hypothetical protein
MTDPKLIETRGEEPAFIPAHMGETWQKVEFGLGATQMRTPPDLPPAPVLPRKHHWLSGFLFILAGIAAFLAFLAERRPIRLIPALGFVAIGVLHLVASRRAWKWF